MKQGATSPFDSDGAGTETLKALLKNLPPHINIHIVGHSTGAILMAHLLRRLSVLQPSLRIKSCSLLAPACKIDDFDEYYEPLITSDESDFGIDKMNVYNLIDELEKDDTVTPAYRKSLLYLVSRAFEDKVPEKILGMEIYSSKVSSENLEILYSKGKDDGSHRSASKVHGGFDNDPLTMNDILKVVLPKDTLPEVHFTDKNLDY